LEIINRMSYLIGEMSNSSIIILYDHLIVICAEDF
jgi:hypothetical protein